MGGFMYLASPYSSESAGLIEERYAGAQRACAWLFARGIWVFSPIAHWHEITKRFALPSAASDFALCNTAMQEASQGTILLRLPGWEESKGCQAEIALTKQIFGEITWMDPQAHQDFSLTLETLR